ncbi:two-component regulator propeller domain-containing protein [Alloacidobacterium sp.]|uniref:two-component regulator propeller domain-containing protein n=1 Tax=Alloacidobacterium sp. TaxID=2951999 RepID=UPI002D5A4A77|nr:two-component regulator propeller domain-containing protein [Alloacidobacterium sp.]HYK36572.1 two-component regulator propeller domain-containing protein [Alloacidobacterium sp.]
MTKSILHGFEILSALLILLNPGWLHAEQVDRTIGQFVHTSWSAKDGAPGNVYALAQTPDGFLWLGTMQGLYRFDGITFERYEPQSGPAFPSSFVTSLLALPNGDLWIGFRDKGVSRLRGSRNTNYTNSDGLPSGRVAKLVQDRDGTIWAGTEGGLARFDHNRWQQVGNDWGYPSGRAAALFVDRRGTLWVASERAVLFLPRGSRKFQTTGIKIGQTYQIVDSPGDTLWMAETTRSVRPILLPANSHSVEPEIQVGSVGILFDDDGSLWITTIGDGMRRVPYPDRLNGQKIGEFSDALESFTTKDGLTSDYATCILKDREGSIWVGTSAGLDRFRRGALVPIPLPAKFALKALVAGNGGDIWVGSVSAALGRIEGNSWKGVLWHTTILSGLRDAHGTLWLLDSARGAGGFTVFRVLRLEQGKLTTFARTSASIHDPWLGTVLAADRLGTLWVGNGPRSLFFLKNGQWERFETPPAVAGKRARATFTDANGRIWFGFTDSTVLVIDGTKVRTFSAKDGLDVGSVMAITGHEGHIWIGGESGLAVWEGDRFRAAIPADNDAFHGVSGIQEDAAGDLFLSEQRGVVFIPETTVSKFLKDPSVRVQYKVFDEHDGLTGAVQQTPPYPTAVQGTDGRIWFSTSAGVDWINPAHMPKNLLPPPVVIRSITANEVRYTSSAGLKLPPRTRDLTIDYTALSLAFPERVRFRYKLEGSDAQWVDAGVRRQAFYTNLSPGHYVFRVMASNNDGVWNDEGAHLDFNIAPAWYQTIWFRGLYILTFIMLLWAVYQIRVHQLQEQEKKFRDAVETMPALAFVADLNGNRTFTNRGWLEYTGLSREEASASGWEKTIHPDDLNRVNEGWRAAQTAGQPLAYEARVRRGCDGIYRWFETRAQPLRDARGKIVKWCAVATDIEDRKRAERLQADLAHVNRVSTMGELTASLAHEIKQPIGAAVTNAEACARLLDRDQPDVLDAREAALEMARDARRAADIIDHVRSLYRKGSSRMETVDVSQVISEMLVILHNEAISRSVTIHIDVADGLPGVMADRVQMQQVLMNLMLNGIQAMETGGVLTIKAQLDQDHRVLISVSDTGIGLSPDKTEQIFDAFFTTKQEGSGMGLAISKSIVESHGGRIWANGEVGRGATFYFTLPAASTAIKPPVDAA